MSQEPAPASSAQPPSSEELLRAIFASASAGIEVIDLETGYVLRVNPALERLFGYPAAELVGRSFEQLTHRDDREREAFLHEEMRAGVRESFSVAERVIRHDGSTLWARVTSSLVRDPEGMPRYAVVMVEDIGGAQQADERRRQAEERYRLIVETASEGIWLLDAEGRTTFANHAMEQMLGYDQGELLGRPLAELLEIDEREVVKKLQRRRAGRSERHAVCYRRKDGTSLEAHVSANGIFDDGGAYLGALGMVTDITELQRSRRATAARLRQLEALSALGREILADVSVGELLDRAAVQVANGLAVDLVTMLERLPDGRFRIVAGSGWDADLRSSALVVPATSQAGYQLDAGQDRLVVEELAREARFRPASVLLDMGVRSGLSCRVDGADGPFGVLAVHTRERREFSHDDANFLDAVASLIGWAIRRDHARAQQAAAEEELRRTAERFRMLADNAQDIVFRYRLGDEPGYEYISPAVERITGLPPETFYADPALALEQPHRDDRSLVSGLSTNEETEPILMRWAHPDGRTVWLERRSTLIRDSSGNSVAAEGIIRDVSERVHEVERRRSLEERLHHAQKMEAVGRLAGGIAHDFNNLLLAVRGYGELALRRVDNGEARAAEDIQEILDAADRASDLTRQLLALSKRQVLRTEVIDLRTVVEETAKLLRRLIGDDIELIVTRSDDPAHVQADRTQLEQVLVNLAVNARDAMPDGGYLRIEVTTTSAGASADALLRVSDTGVGMDAATAARAFEPFFTTKGDSGTGLGLATVYGIVVQSGGRIDVASEPGRGATFTITFPLSDAPAVPGTTLLPAAPAGDARILVVEDEATVRGAVVRMLSDRGYQVLEAADGDAALAYVAEGGEPVDLLLTDLVLPGMSGRETARRVCDFNPQMPVLFMSGYTEDPAIREDGLDERSAFIQKPFSGEELARRIADLIVQRPS